MSEPEPEPVAEREGLVVNAGVRCAVVDHDHLVVNVIIAPSDFEPGEGLELVLVGNLNVSVGDTLCRGRLTKAERGPGLPATLEERVAALEAAVRGEGEP